MMSRRVRRRRSAQLTQEQIVDYDQVRGFDHRAVFSELAEFTRLMDVIDEDMRLAIEHRVTALHGKQRECLGDVTFSDTGDPMNNASSR